MARVNYKVAPNVNVESNDLLRIIDAGIDNIIVNLKNAVDKKGITGNIGDIARTNEAVTKIVEVFTQFKSGIAPELGQMKDKNIIKDKSLVSGVIDLPPNYYGSNTSAVLSDKGLLYKNYDDATSHLSDGKSEADILDLGTGIRYKSYTNEYSPNIEITDSYQVPLLARLENCRRLEDLYLQKHTEIIKIFSFVINLFDKYKYAIKVILFLLKNLVRAEQRLPPPPGGNVPGSVTINLPKPLITNIDLLLKDQANIQTIINGMTNVVTKTHSSISVDPIIKTRINESLNDLDSPPNPPQSAV